MCRDSSAGFSILLRYTERKIRSYDTFHYHATKTRNDFGNWVRDVICIEDSEHVCLPEIKRGG